MSKIYSAPLRYKMRALHVMPEWLRFRKHLNYKIIKHESSIDLEAV